MAAAQPKNQIELTPTAMPHIFLCDVDDTGLLKQIAVLKRYKDGSISYIDIGTLHDIDKSRLKRVIMSVHADKYELFELMSQGQLSNGMNTLDFFHTNFAKVKRPRGANATIGGLETVDAARGDGTIGSGFSDPSSATLAGGNGKFVS